MAIQDSDLLIVTRGSVNYKTPALNVKSYIGDVGGAPLLNVVVATTWVTVSHNDYVVVQNAGLGVQLPANPVAGSVVHIVVAGSFTNTLVVRNGSNIMGLAEDLTLDKPYAAMQFTYINSTHGWRIS